MTYVKRHFVIRPAESLLLKETSEYTLSVPYTTANRVCQVVLHVFSIFPWPVSRKCKPQEPGRIEYYNQLFCLRGHLGGVSEIQTSLDVSDL